MAKNKGKAQVGSIVTQYEGPIPEDLPKIKGMTKAQVRQEYVTLRSTHLAADGTEREGLGHIRAILRLRKMANGQPVPAVSALRRYTAPLEQPTA